jgi:hypothetical protein
MLVSLKRTDLGHRDEVREHRQHVISARYSRLIREERIEWWLLVEKQQDQHLHRQLEAASLNT